MEVNKKHGNYETQKTWMQLTWNHGKSSSTKKSITTIMSKLKYTIKKFSKFMFVLIKTSDVSIIVQKAFIYKKFMNVSVDRQTMI